MGLSSIAGDYAVLESQLHLASVRLGQRRSTEARNAAREMTLDEAIAYATATGDLRKVEAHPAGRLSPREREVAALVARGLSNRTIATQLSITERTAGAHVEHILDKLGFTSRTQIGVWAAEHALLTRTPS
jgi:non-specific serine/threonine protein kinase